MTYPLTFEYDARLATWAIAAACRFWPLLGRARALRLALWSYRLVRWRIARGRWHWGAPNLGCCLVVPGQPPEDGALSTAEIVRNLAVKRSEP